MEGRGGWGRSRREPAEGCGGWGRSRRERQRGAVAGAQPQGPWLFRARRVPGRAGGCCAARVAAGPGCSWSCDNTAWGPEPAWRVTGGSCAPWAAYPAGKSGVRLPVYSSPLTPTALAPPLLGGMPYAPLPPPWSRGQLAPPRETHGRGVPLLGGPAFTPRRQGVLEHLRSRGRCVLGGEGQPGQCGGMGEGPGGKGFV